MVKDKAKSKIKWRLIWSAYLMVAVPVVVPVIILFYLNVPFAWLAERIGSFKDSLIEKYKPEG